MKTSSIRAGVDIGGTFTDVVLEVGSERFSIKVLTTHAAPEDAILDGIGQVCARAGIDPGTIGQVIHGTTLATNALITTEGFRDVIEMRTESRFEQYDLNLRLPDPLLPRQRRYTVRERISAAGDVLIPLDRAEVEAVVDDHR
ncbi:MAG: hydantoinase/oxoprolinase family protein, partial [Rhizobiales bacterium]|nr:hydantoinase/oxoprolinase family protein [Hyphomicrobiales bacterium]